MNEHGTSTPEPAGEASGRSARERSALALLRQLWLGLASYRLYPDNPERVGFDAVVDRIGRAAEDALAVGIVDLEIRGDRFVLAGGALPEEESLVRLARVCFERRVERLTVSGVPDATDLERLYATLTRSPADLEDAGGVEQAMADTGVTSLSLSHIGPGTVDEADHVPPDLADDAETRRAGVDVLAAELILEDLHGSPHDQAETLLARLHEVMEQGLPPDSRIDVHAAAHDMLTELPADVRRSMIEMLVERAPRDPVAGSLIGTMNNAELTRALVDAGGSGRSDAVELARTLAKSGVRQVDIVDLTRALEAGHEDAGTIIAGLEQLGVDLSPDAIAAQASGSVLEVLAQYLSATQSDDVRSVQEAIASSAEDLRSAQILAIADYVALETDLERAGEALSIWSDELRNALTQRDERAVASLIQPVRETLLGGEEDRPALFEAYVRRALTREVVFDAVTAEAADGHPHLAAMLSPFGDDGVEVLLDLLADEEDRQRRALLLGALRRIAAVHPDPVVARLRDERWYVVRNAVSILGSAGGPPVVSRLAEVAGHAAPEVRREVPEALANAGGPAAVPALARIAVEGAEDVRASAVTSLGTVVGAEATAGLADVAARSRDRAIRLHAVDVLAQRPDGAPALRDLVAGDGRTRLPWRIRRYAKRALARAEQARR